MAYLELVKGVSAGGRFELAGERAIIGRSDDCEVPIDVPAASRRHAAILYVGGRYFVEDLISSNGTFLNYNRVTERSPLNDGDQILICDHEFRFHLSHAVPTLDFCQLHDSLQKNHLHVTGEYANRLQEALLEKGSEVFANADPYFHKIVVLDASKGKTDTGQFRIEKFLRYMMEKMGAEFKFPISDSMFHPELIAQVLKDERSSLFCFVNVQEFAEEDLHCLRGLGFTQENHRILYCGPNVYLTEKTFRFDSSSSQTRETLSEIDDEMSVLFRHAVAFETGSWAGNSAEPEVNRAAMREIADSLAQSLTVEDILPKVLDSLFKIFVQADRGFIVMHPKADGPLVPAAVKFRRPGDERMRISRTIVEEAMKSGKAILSADASSDERFGMAHSIADFSIHSMMCAPMLDNNWHPIGVIQIDTQNQRSRFTDSDLDVLVKVARQVAVAIGRAMQRDRDLARRIQRTLIPSKPPKVPGYSFFDYHRAAREVHGDYYDYVPLPGGRFAVVVGKCVPAALLMDRLSADTRFWLASEENPVKAVEQINEGFFTHDWQGKIVTLLVAVLTPQTGEVLLVNAGHTAPLLRVPDAVPPRSVMRSVLLRLSPLAKRWYRSDGRVAEIWEDAVGMPLGAARSFNYQSYSFNLESGDVVVFCSDGLINAMNSASECYGIKRLSQQLSMPAVTTDEIGKNIVQDVVRFIGDVEPTDDICLVCLGRS